MAQIEGMTTAQASQLSSAQLQSSQPAAQSIEDQAKEILEVGERFGTDDYDKRAEAFADTVAQADKATREDLLTEILKQDPAALSSWLSPERINDLVDEGRISQAERSTLAETFAGVYNNGGFTTYDIYPSLYSSEPITTSAIDNSINSVSESPTYSDQTLDEAARISAFAKFIDSGTGPETAEFRQNYAEHLTETYVLNDAVGTRQRNAAAALAAELLTGDPTRPDIAVNALSKLDTDQLATFIDHVASGSAMFNRDFIAPRIEGNPRYDINDLAMRDGLAAIYQSVASAGIFAPSSKASNLAVELATSTDQFVGDGQNSGLQSRTNAFGRLVNNHSDAILDALTKYDRTNVSTVSDSDAEQYEVNAQNLAEVLELTAFNPDSPYQAAIQDKIISYANEQAEAINNAGGPNSDGFEDAVGRLSVLSAASSHAVTESFDAIAADRAAQQALIGFVVDLALAAVPLGKIASTGAKNAIAESLPEGHLRTAIQGLSGQLINQATGQLTTEAKEQLYETLSDDVAAAVVMRELQNLLEPAFIAGITDQRDQSVVITRTDSLTHDLAN